MMTMVEIMKHAHDNLQNIQNRAEIKMTNTMVTDRDEYAKQRAIREEAMHKAAWLRTVISVMEAK